MFEYFQDRDGLIRIKPAFWNKDVLKNLGELLLNNPLMSMFEPNPNNHPPIIYK